MLVLLVHVIIVAIFPYLLCIFIHYYTLYMLRLVYVYKIKLHICYDYYLLADDYIIRNFTN